MAENPIIGLAKTTWKYSAGNRRNVILFLLLFLGANTVAFLEPLLVGKILNIIQEQGISQATVWNIIPWLCVFVIISIAFWAFHGPGRLLETANAFLARAQFKQYLIEGTMSLPAAWHTDHHSGDTIDKIEKASQALYRYANHIFEIMEMALRFIGSYLALAYFNLHASYIVLLIVIMTLWLIVKFDKILIPQYRELYRVENRIAARIFDSISNITTIIILRIEKLVSRAIFKKIMQPYDLYLRNNKINELKWAIVSFCSATMMTLVLVTFVITKVNAGEVVLIGTIYVLYGYVQRISGVFFRFAYTYGDIVRGHTAVNNVKPITDEFKARTYAKNVPLDQWNELEVKNLDFTYHSDEGSDLHLQDVGFTIKRGQRIAFIGASGSGKTTALKLIRELYSPQHVDVLLDGKPMPKGFASISKHITLIPQDPEIFNTTIKKNITMGVTRTMQHIKKYTDLAQFTKVAEKLPHKFESSVQEKGVNLSGGEKQRLALSRGLLACENKQIVLLDEPTSSVDPHNELKIYKNVFKEFKDKTIISSIHRLHLLPHFDQIYLFRKGKVIAHGSYDELLKTSPLFKMMWKKYKAKGHE